MVKEAEAGRALGVTPPAVAARLRRLIAAFGLPVRVPAGVVKVAAGDKTLLYFLDPDGVILELAEYG